MYNFALIYLWQYVFSCLSITLLSVTHCCLLSTSESYLPLPLSICSSLTMHFKRGRSVSVNRRVRTRHDVKTRAVTLQFEKCTHGMCPRGAECYRRAVLMAFPERILPTLDPHMTFILTSESECVEEGVVPYSFSCVDCGMPLLYPSNIWSHLACDRVTHVYLVLL